MSRQVELVNSRTLEVVQGYLDAVRRGDHCQPFSLAMAYVRDGACPVEWVRDALATGLRSLAGRWRRIAATPGYRFTEGRSAAYYEEEADRCEALADHIDMGEGFTFQGVDVPQTAKKAQEKLLRQLRDQPTAAFTDARGSRLHFLTSEDRIHWATFQRDDESGLKVAGQQGIVNVDFPLKSIRGDNQTRIRDAIKALSTIMRFTERIQLGDNPLKV